MFELGARPHPPQALYRAYLEQSDVFVGIYGETYGWVAPGMEISGLEDEYELARSKPKLVYVKEVDEREPALAELLRRIAAHDVSYRHFQSWAELAGLLADDLAVLVSERFAPRPTAAVSVTPLPVPISSFVGRERELLDVVELVLRDDVRLLTLTGPGGIGKTRLALEASRQAAGRFADGVVFVPLAAVSDPDDVGPTIGEALGVRVEPGASSADGLPARLAELELLLVLDNLEHVVSSVHLVRRLLEAAPRLTVLATSRVRLDVGGEHLFQVPPLGLPEDLEEPAEASRSDAVRLFATRAAAAGWTTSEADVPLITDMVRRLDGLPLAIELAAAQARLVPAELIHTRLRRRLDLVGGPRDAEERHRTLRSTIAWSYDLLDDNARRVFETLSVFVGGFSLDAAEAVVECDDTEGVLASLVDASLLATVPAPASGVRFVMLETIHEYAGERLRERGARDEAALRHREFFALLADDAYGAGPDRRLITRLRLDEEYENFRAALDEASRTAPDEAVRLAGALGSHFDRRGLTATGREVIADALAAAPDAPPKWRARALLYGAWMAAEHDECDEADRQAQEALVLFRSLADQHGIGSALNTLGYSAAMRGDDEAAIELYDESFRAFSADDRDWRLYPAVNLATVLLASRRDLDRARGLFREALAFFAANEFEDEAATVRLRMGELEEALGDLESAQTWAEEGVATCRRIGNKQLLAWMLVRLAHVHAAGDRFDEAARSFGEAFDIHLELGQRTGVAYTVECISRLAFRTGSVESAARLLGAAGRMREALSVAMPSLEQQEADETERQVRASLGDAGYTREYDRGSAMMQNELAELVHEVLAAPSP